MPQLREMQSEHRGGFDILVKAVAGGPLTSEERTAGERFLAGLFSVVTQNDHLHHLIYNSARDNAQPGAWIRSDFKPPAAA